MLPCMFYLWPVSLGLTISLELEVIFPLKKVSWSLRYLKARMTSSVEATKSSSHNCLVLHASMLLKRYLAMFRIPLIQKMLFSSPFLGKGS